MNIAVFMDRDGTINEERDYLKTPYDLSILPGAADAIRLINKNRIKAVVITNQSGVARGYFSEEVVERVHMKLEELLKEKGAYLDGIYYCPHHPDFGPPGYRQRCNCRKPAPGLLETASKELTIDLSHSYVVGDKAGDIELAHRVGARGVLVLTGHGKDETGSLHRGPKSRPHYIAENILAAANWILQDLQVR